MCGHADSDGAHWVKCRSVVPANGGQLRLLLHFFSKDLQLLLERLLVVVGVDVVVVWNDRRQELGAGEAEQLFKHLQVSGNEEYYQHIKASHFNQLSQNNKRNATIDFRSIGKYSVPHPFCIRSILSPYFSLSWV